MSGRIVVGVDGSPGSDAALRWALTEAHLRGASIDAVHAWTYPYVADVAYLARASIDREEVAASAKEVLREALARVADEAKGIRIDEIVVEGSASHMLTEAAKGADLLVLGTRGHGGFSGLLLGSVSQQAAHHATCPVVIVPAPH